MAPIFLALLITVYAGGIAMWLLATDCVVAETGQPAPWYINVFAALFWPVFLIVLRRRDP